MSVVDINIKFRLECFVLGCNNVLEGTLSDVEKAWGWRILVTARRCGGDDCNGVNHVHPVQQSICPDHELPRMKGSADS